MLTHRLSRMASLLLAAVLQPAQAHDTWFEVLPGPALALGTGNRFPAQETGIDRSFLVHQGCHLRDGSTRPMEALDDEPAALQLRPPASARSCWMQLAPLQIEVAPALVPVYLNEISASAELRRIWDGRRASRCMRDGQPLAGMAGRAAPRERARWASGAHRRAGPRAPGAAAGRAGGCCAE
jgi:hypothetical protein